MDHGKVQAVLRVLPGYARDVKRGNSASVQILVDGTNSNTASIVASYATQIVLTHASQSSRGPTKLASCRAHGKNRRTRPRP